MISNFSEKMDNLSKALQSLLLCDYGGSLEFKIFKKYKLPLNKRYLIGEIVSRVYFGELELNKILFEIENGFNLDKEIAKKVTLDIIGMRIYPINNLLKIDSMERVFLELDGDLSNYDKFVNRYFEKAENKTDRLDTNNKSDKSYKYNSENEKKDTYEIFLSVLYYFLSVKNNSFLRDYNFILIELLSEDTTFKHSIVNLILENQEKLTSKPFSIETKSKSPTISNWLKDFIKFHGSGMFDSIVLGKYLANSDNVKVLSNDEKKLVKKLLLLYRNIKFFPESMPSDNVEDWEIFPIEKVNDGVIADRKRKMKIKKEEAVAKSKFATPAPIDPVKAKKENMESKRDKELMGLKTMLLKYKPGTLEYSAIMEEIKKIS